MTPPTRRECEPATRAEATTRRPTIADIRAGPAAEEESQAIASDARAYAAGRRDADTAITATPPAQPVPGQARDANEEATMIIPSPGSGNYR
ncbi:hypothetical protein [Micromonospora inyonensis]|uniref:Uncharacterized protein n=1 Tax=Micromonospora inyonensis TaxID=47866 RepID=A0A1C6SIL1_9ACTN|nr:hypothetical protein [Micromonospora inyonensis]SCL29273.1 hypothetical protein GA0074694_5354 [Micromonospora inyonensis]